MRSILERNENYKHYVALVERISQLHGTPEQAAVVSQCYEHMLIAYDEMLALCTEHAAVFSAMAGNPPSGRWSTSQEFVFLLVSRQKSVEQIAKTHKLSVLQVKRFFLLALSTFKELEDMCEEQKHP